MFWDSNLTLMAKTGVRAPQFISTVGKSGITGYDPIHIHSKTMVIYNIYGKSSQKRVITKIM